MKKIGIITVHNSPNYGASLQSYALWKYIDSLSDCQCEVIDLYRPYQKEYIKSKRYKGSREKNLPWWRKELMTLKKSLKQIFRPNKKGTVKLFSDKALPKFEEFNNKVRLSSSYAGPDELYVNPPKYDVYMSGSDQLWNPEQPWALEPYFLTFAPKGAKKVAYGSSIGIETLTKREKQNFKKWLSDYSAIGVREKSAHTLLESIGINSTIVCDPTFLLGPDYWKSIAIKPKQEDYILLFTLNVEPHIKEFAIKIAQKANKRLVVLSQYDVPSENYVLIDDAGPREFIGFIQHASLVITNSFHGTVFSLIMGANNFFTYIDPKNTRGVRIIDLLDTYHLSDHLLNVELNQSYQELSNITVDQKSIYKILEEERERSINFLTQSI